MPGSSGIPPAKPPWPDPAAQQWPLLDASYHHDKEKHNNTENTRKTYMPTFTFHSPLRFSPIDAPSALHTTHYSAPCSESPQESKNNHTTSQTTSHQHEHEPPSANIQAFRELKEFQANLDVVRKKTATAIANITCPLLPYSPHIPIQKECPGQVQAQLPPAPPKHTNNDEHRYKPHTAYEHTKKHHAKQQPHGSTQQHAHKATLEHHNDQLTLPYTSPCYDPRQKPREPQFSLTYEVETVRSACRHQKAAEKLIKQKDKTTPVTQHITSDGPFYEAIDTLVQRQPMQTSTEKTTTPLIIITTHQTQDTLPDLIPINQPHVVQQPTNNTSTSQENRTVPSVDHKPSKCPTKSLPIQITSQAQTLINDPPDVSNTSSTSSKPPRKTTLAAPAPQIKSAVTTSKTIKDTTTLPAQDSKETKRLIKISTQRPAPPPAPDPDLTLFRTKQRAVVRQKYLRHTTRNYYRRTTFTTKEETNTPRPPPDPDPELATMGTKQRQHIQHRFMRFLRRNQGRPPDR